MNTVPPARAVAGRCRCWTAAGGASLHEGHCCFAAGPSEAYRPDAPVPCGHDPLNVDGQTTGEDVAV